MLKIKRNKDVRAVKCILHRTEDIPGGGTVSVADLGGSVLYEGTPVGVGSNGLYKVVKTARVVTAAVAGTSVYEVAKGHHFKVGEFLCIGAADGREITGIDKSDPVKDKITIKGGLGAQNVGAVAHQTTGENKTVSVTAVGVAGTTYNVEAKDSLFEDIWVIGVVKESVAPPVTDAIKASLKTIIYV